MRIGIDASRLAEFDRTGTENYLYYLVKSIAKLDKENEYILYFKREPSNAFWQDLVGENHRFSYKTIKSNLSWTQIALALACIHDDINLLLETWQTLPIIHKSGMKIVSVIHGMEYSRGRGGPTIYSCLFSDKIVAVSDFTKKQIIKVAHIKDSKVSTIYEGVNTLFFYKRSWEEIEKIRNKYEIVGDYMLSIGSYGSRKNTARVLEAFSKIIEGGNYSKLITLVLAGKGYNEYKNIPKNMVGRVKILGYADQDNLPALISGAKFLLYPSLSEGFGLPILESMACGTPVITSNNSAMKEVGGSGVYFVNPKSSDSIYSGIFELLNNENLVKELSTEGESWVKNFTWDKCAQAMLNVFKGAVNVKR